MTLEVATEGCCKGHKCDNCKTCQGGRCCRRDNPNYQLPKVGEWDGPIYGKIGVLGDDGDKAECHICGEWFVGLGQHVWSAHGIMAKEYKAIFGLPWNRGLESPSTFQRLADKFREHLSRTRRLVPSNTGLWAATQEQRGFWHEYTHKRRVELGVAGVVWGAPPQTKCRRGHELTPENTMIIAGGRKTRCRQCFRITDARAKSKKRLQIAKGNNG